MVWWLCSSHTVHPASFAAETMHFFAQYSAMLYRMEQQRQQLEPQVHKWTVYEAQASTFQTRKLNFLQQQAESLTVSISTTTQQVRKWQQTWI